MKKNQTQIKKYAAVISIFLAAVIVGLFVFFFCIKRSVEQRSKNTMRNNVVRQSEHLRTILDIQYDYLNALAEEIGKTDHLLAKKNMDLILDGVLTESKRPKQYALVGKMQDLSIIDQYNFS